MVKMVAKEKEFSYSVLETQLRKKDDFQEEIFYSFYDTADLSQLFIASTQYGICFLAPVASLQFGVDELKKQFPKAISVHKKTAIQEQAASFLNAGLVEGKIPLHLIGTAFQLKVWIALLSIPTGKMTTYQSIARQIGHTQAYRAIGTAIGRNPISLLVPCHRVIRSDGKLGGYRWGIPFKEKILDLESSKTE